jgi:hypothetical protein
MTIYTKAELSKLARFEAKAVCLSSGHPARVKAWGITISGAEVSLIVMIESSSGIRQRNVAI